MSLKPQELDDGLFSVEDVLGGISSVKRAKTLLYLIENQTSKSIEESHRAATIYLPITSEPSMAYIDAFVQPSNYEPTVYELEEYADKWRYLVPDNPEVQAALAQLIGEKYPLAERRVPGIRSALGLSDRRVQQAYESAYKQSTEAIYQKEQANLTWFWASISKRLEQLPTFWVTFFLTLPIGPGLLALPIALAGIGVIPSVILLVVFGLINMVTAGAVAESFARTGDARYGIAFLGRMVEVYLGRTSSAFLTIVLTIDLFLILIAFYIGVASTLSVTFGLPTLFWAVVMFATGIFFLSRGSLNATIASTLIIGTVNIALIILISLFTLQYVDPAKLQYANVPLGSSFDTSIFQLIFGVLLAAYLNHLLIGNYAKVALRRDPSSKSYIQGSMASIAVTIVLSCLWVIAINGSIDADTLANEKATVLVPLAGLVGGWVNFFGAIFVILSLGLASVHLSFALYYTVLERVFQLAKLKLFAGTLGEAMKSERMRFGIGAFPLVLVLLATIYMLQTNSGSFSALLSFLGVVAISLFAGIYPMQLLVASRRKGDMVPQKVYKYLGNPILIVGIYLIFLASIFAHGLVIWTDPLQRIGAIVAGIFVVATTFTAYREGAFKPRLVVEVTKVNPHEVQVNVIENGEAAQTQISLVYSDLEAPLYQEANRHVKLANLNHIDLLLHTDKVSEIEVWVHELGPDGNSTGLDFKVDTDLQKGTLTGNNQMILPVKQQSTAHVRVQMV